MYACFILFHYILSCFQCHSAFYYSLYFGLIYTPLIEIYNPRYVVFQPDILFFDTMAVWMSYTFIISSTFVHVNSAENKIGFTFLITSQICFIFFLAVSIVKRQ